MMLVRVNDITPSTVMDYFEGRPLLGVLVPSGRVRILTPLAAQDYGRTISTEWYVQENQYVRLTPDDLTDEELVLLTTWRLSPHET